MTQAHLDDPEPQPPEAPADNECCGSGCEFCVMDVYYSELNQWKAAHRAWLARQTSSAQS